jgi:hypothetical protein
MASLEHLYFNKRRKTREEVLTEHQIETLEQFKDWLTSQALVASPETLKEVELDLVVEEVPVKKHPKIGTSKKTPVSENEQFQQHKELSPSMLPETEMKTTQPESD